MNFGQPLDEERWIRLVRQAHASGVTTFITADVYGTGAADTLLGKALAGLDRQSYQLVGLIGHDFYATRRDGAKGYPRFTDPKLRPASGYRDYLRMAAEKSLERCQTDHFDLLMLHNPDSIGYSSDRVWTPMMDLRDLGLAKAIGVAPGPANGFTLDLLLCLERFGSELDWAMIILNPFEPWPGSLVLPAAQAREVRLMARVVDYGGIFNDDVRPGHTFGPSDHRSYRPAGWVEAAADKLDQIKPIAHRHGLTPLQLSSTWCLQHPPVKCVVPTLIEEVGPSSKSIETKLTELASLPEVSLSPDELERIGRVGDNRGCMHLKGGSPTHQGEPLPDQWSLNSDLNAVAQRWGIRPERDLVFLHG